MPVLDRFDDVLADIIQSYDLAKLQTNDFTPKTKDLLLGILRVTRLLLENCTSRKLYASYDVSPTRSSETLHPELTNSDWQICC